MGIENYVYSLLTQHLENSAQLEKFCLNSGELGLRFSPVILKNYKFLTPTPENLSFALMSDV